MYKKLGALTIVFVLLSACSVGMALSGKPAPNLGAITVGKTRGEIETNLGAPVTSYTLGNGNRVDTYEYEIGNEQSTGRAVGHAAMDVLTFGAWEIVGTPIEGFTGEKYTATLTYDSGDKVIDIKTKKVSRNM